MSIDRDGEIVASRGSCAALGFVFAAFALAADQAHKFWVLDVIGIRPGDRIPVLPFVDYVYASNKGVSYGWFQLDSTAGQWGLAAFAVLASVVIGIWLTRVTGRVLGVSLGLIIGGAIGNAIDRVRLGGVFDYISFHVGDFYWYIFNIADVAIVAGVAGLLYDSLVLSRKSASKSA
ncbi:MAG: signal peptidase II [Hyphomicrobiaceae bacterium]